MAIPVKVLLFLGGASAAAVGTAYVAGVFEPRPVPPANISQPVTPPSVEAPSDKAEAAPPSVATDGVSAAAPAAEVTPAPEQQAAVAQPAKPEPIAPPPAAVAPTFDLLRVEPDGSVVIAGKAMAGSVVEALAGSRLLGQAEAGANGDFVIILDDPLKPGDYQVVLRSNGPGQIVVSSVETAVVSVPETPDGQVLALVEQPGAPSKLITVTPAPEEVPPVAEAQTTQPQEPEAQAPAPAAPSSTVMVEAVEIDGRKIFIAGAAPAGATVRGYANALLLGDAKASPDGRFLIEAERDLPVGDYIVRVDVLSANGDKVLARATVPFKREQGESIAAVAPRPAAVPAAAPETNTPEDEAKPEVAEATQPAAPSNPVVESKAPQTEVAQEAATAPQLEPSASGVIIRRGDTLWHISKRVYGRGTRYSTIYAANKTQIADPNRIWPGQVFRVPDTSQQGESADMDTVKDQATTVQ